MASEAGLLGCGEYEVLILTRGGKDLVARAPWTNLNWQRVIDDTSKSSFQLDTSCLKDIAPARPWRHEISIVRDNEEVWAGPLIQPTAPIQGDHVVYLAQARDLTAWWDHRRIHFDHSWADVDLSTMFEEIADDAMSVDRSPGLVVSGTPCGVRGTRTILALQHQMAGPTLRELTDIGVDWTVIARTVLMGGAVVPTDSIGTLHDEDFIVPPVPSYDGLSQANSWIVRGAGGGGEQPDTIFGTGRDPAAGHLDGVLESVDTITSIQDNESATSAARSRTDLTKEVLVLQDCVLSPKATVTLAELVPGSLVDIAVNEAPIPVTGRFRLQRVNVTASQSTGGEQISLALQPPGTE